MRHRALSLLFFVFVSTLYYATASGVTSSNDGSSYALVRSIVDEHRFQIDTFYNFTENIDAAVRDGKTYSDRAPGTALLAAPFYCLGGYLPHPIATLPSRHDYGNPQLAYMLMLPALAGAGTTMLLYYFLRANNLSTFASLTACLSFAFGTLNWKYGGTLFTHELSGFLVLAGVVLAIRCTRAGHLPLPSAWLLGLVLGSSVLAEYSNALFVVLTLIYLILRLNRALVSARHWWVAMIALTVGLLIPTGFLFWYNTLNFGGPFTTSYTYNVSFPWTARFSTTFSFPIVRGLVGMLWSGSDINGLENQGIFLLMPVTVVSLGGLWSYLRRYRAEAVLVLGVFIVYLLLFSTHRTFGGGSTADGRYLSPFLALLFVPLGFVLEHLHISDEDTPYRALLSIGFYGLLFLSVRNMFVHIAFSNNYFLDPANLAPWAASLSNWSYILGSVFVNWKNVSLLWMVEISAIVLLLGVAWAWSSWGTQAVVLLDKWLPHRWRQPLALIGVAFLLLAIVFGFVQYFQPASQAASRSATDAHALSLRYADVAELVGIKPSLVRAQLGGAAYVTLTWRALRPADSELMVYLHSLDGSLVQFDDWPAGGDLPSTDWTPGQSWTEQYIIVIPAQSESQVVYPLVSGLYDPDADFALSATDSEGREVTPIVGNIVINGPPDPFDPDYRFGDVIGLADPEITRDGDALKVCLRWVSLAPTSTDYHVFIHILSGEGDLIAQADIQPKNGLYPTSVWIVGEAVDDCVTLDTLQLPDRWMVAIGLYELTSEQRLQVVDRDGLLLDNGMVVITPR